MVFILSKLFAYLIQPAVWIFVILIFAIFKKEAKTRRRLFISATVMILLFSNAFIIGKVFNAYEAAPPQDQHYDIGIVLGGFSGYDEHTGEIIFNNSAERFYKTIELYKNGRIDRILISGGNGNLLDDKKLKEADLAARYLQKIGIPDSVVLIENRSRNTVENARFSKQLIERLKPDAKVIVITSAWHIPRARLIFSKHFSSNIDYYPTDYIGKTSYGLSDILLPSVASFISWQFIIKEWIGLLVDRFRA